MYNRIINKIKSLTRPVYQINYIIEDANWSIKWDGTYITEKINKQFNASAGIRSDFENIRNKIVHFGSRNIYLPEHYKRLHDSNKVIFTWFHGTEEDKKFIDSLPEGSRNADIIHTSCQLSRDQLINWGAEEEKIKIIPLGVDLDIFKPLDNEKKQLKRKNLGIPDNAIVIGSFQKDGVGWEEGNEPKLIKGPDIFCDVIEKLAKNYPVYVFLTGPARGYVKKRLADKNIPYNHIFFDNFKDIAGYFNILDLYIISSRAEGGPKAVLESMASGVPLISTKVGMAPDVIQSGLNGYLADTPDDLEKYAEVIINDKEKASDFKKNGLNTVLEYDWTNIAKRYYEELYQQFIN